jgi:hypothetical protein
MNDFAIFICGVVITLVTGMGVITSQVFMGYNKFKEYQKERDTKVFEQI